MPDVPRFTVAPHGYDRAQVDAHCLRVEATLAGTAGELAITADEAVNPVFAMVAHGYDHQEVEAWVRGRAALLAGGPQTGRATVVSGPPDARFPVVRLHEGYDLAEVDAFVERIQATMATTLRIDDVKNIEFTTVRLHEGYDMRAVDEYLDEVIARLSGTSAAADDDELTTTEWRESLDERYELLSVANQERGQRFGRSGFAKGYDPDQVDAFADHVRGTLTTSLTRAEVMNVHFDDARGGYRHREVDAWLVAVEEHARG